MSNELFVVDILTPERKVIEIKARQVVMQTVDGSIGVLPNHIPLVAPLAPIYPVILWPETGKEFDIAVTGGFVEVRPKHISILATTAELPEEIDVDRAKRAKERAEERLQRERGEIDYFRANAALQRAMMRLVVAEKGSHE